MPGQRYQDWTHVQIEGDRAAAPAYMPLARKLLGYLDEQRRLQPGAPTQAIERRHPDGTIVRAKFFGEIPQVEIITPRAQLAPPEPFALQGFVLTPNGTDENAYLETVLTRARGAWRAVFFDADHKPAEYPGATLIYSKVRGLSVLDAPPGLQYSGVIDWRNTDETMCVSWAGSTARYFSVGSFSGRDRYVHYKGERLFDVQQLDPEHPDSPRDLSTATVNGACLRKHEGRLWLIVVLRSGNTSDWPPASNRFDTVIAVPLARAATAPAPPVGSKIEQSPRLEVGYDQVRYLGDRLIEEDTYEYGHPWLFNQSGTQARTMRPEFYTVVREMILSIDADITEATFEQITEPWRTVTTTTVGTKVYSPLRMTGASNWAHADPGDTGPTIGPLELTHLPGAAGFGPGSNDYEREWLVAENTAVTTAADGKVKCAVDWIDDVPVYAYWLPPDNVRNLTLSREWSGSLEAMLSDIDTHAGVGFLDTDPATLWSIRYSGFDNESLTWTRSDVTTGHEGGLEFPWGTCVRALNNSTVDSGTFTGSMVWDWSETVLDTPDGDPSVTPPWVANGASGPGGGTTGDLSFEINRTIPRSQASVGYDRTFYCDLRYGWHVYLEEEETFSGTTTTIGTKDYLLNPGDQVVDHAPLVQDSSIFFQQFGSVMALKSGDNNDVGELGTGGSTVVMPGAVHDVGESLSERRYVVSINNNILARTVLTSTGSNTDTTSDFRHVHEFGGVIVFGLSRSGDTILIPGRTPADYVALPVDTETEVPQNTSDGGIESDYMYEGYANDGSWQTYRGFYCYSCPACDTGHAPVAYLQGLGVAATGGADPDGPPGPLIGYPSAQVLWPISILPPTRPA